MHAVEEGTVRAKLGIPVKAAITWEEPEVRGEGSLHFWDLGGPAATGSLHASGLHL